MFLYGASDKVTLVLCSDKFDFALLLDLVIDLRSVIIAWNLLKVTEYNQTSCTVFDGASVIKVVIAVVYFIKVFKEELTWATVYIETSGYNVI